MDYNIYIQNLKNRRNNILEGKLNCLPLPFLRFRKWIPGLEKKKYIGYTASQKVGKSKIVDFIHLYEPFFMWMDNPNFDFEVLYFTLEMSVEEKFYEFLSHLIYRLDRIRISPTDLKSVNNDNPLSSTILELIESDKYKNYIDKFYSKVQYFTISNPTGINKLCRGFMEKEGYFTYKIIPSKQEDGSIKEVKIIDTFVPNNPDKYYIIILDNFANVTTESGLSKRESLEKLSKYFITLRDQLNYSIITVIHQAQAQEGIDNIRMNITKPSSAGLGDAKTIVRDLNKLLGLYSPFKYSIKEYEGYDITKFRNYIRFLEILEDRDGGGQGQICPLFFDGAITGFAELPLPKDLVNLRNIYKRIDELNNIHSSFFLFFKNKNK